MIQARQITLLNAVTATTTSAGVPVENAGRLSFHFKAASITSGNGVMTVDVSNDGGATWVPYNRLVSNVTNTNAQNDARVASLTLNANGGSMVFVPASDTFGLVRATVTRTTDGAYSVIAYIN